MPVELHWEPCSIPRRVHVGGHEMAQAGPLRGNGMRLACCNTRDIGQAFIPGSAFPALTCACVPHLSSVHVDFKYANPGKTQEHNEIAWPCGLQLQQCRGEGLRTGCNDTELNLQGRG